jgi:hypothetical protein
LVQSGIVDINGCPQVRYSWSGNLNFRHAKDGLWKVEIHSF